jgi:uncharacterized delta-60 repeat protein
VAVGDRNGEGSDFALARYLPTGRKGLDDSFGLDGMVTTDFGGGEDSAVAVVVQGDGKIVVAGSSRSAGVPSQFALARYNPDGRLDVKFGEEGRVLTAVQGAVAQAAAVALQEDGKIVVGGATDVGPASDFAIARYLRGGAIDPSFGEGGLVRTSVTPGDDRVVDLLVQGEGKIVAAGVSGAGSTNRVTLARYNVRGALDPSFGVSGVTRGRPLLHLFGFSGSVAEDASGRLIVAANGAVARFAPDGRLDRAFASDGYVLGLKVIAAAPEHRGGGIYVASPANFRVLRLMTAGYRDKRFGRGGLLQWYWSEKNDYHEVVARALELTADGKLTLVGSAQETENSLVYSSFAIARFTTRTFCLVPSLRLEPLRRARAAIGRSDCRLGRVTRAYSSRIREGRVIAQSPPRRSRLARGGRVALVVSRGATNADPGRRQLRQHVWGVAKRKGEGRYRRFRARILARDVGCNEPACPNRSTQLHHDPALVEGGQELNPNHARGV